MEDLNCDYRIDFAIRVRENAERRLTKFAEMLDKATVDDDSVTITIRSEVICMNVAGCFCLTDKEFEEFTQWLDTLASDAVCGAVVSYSVLQSIQPTEVSEVYFGTEVQKNKCKRNQALGDAMHSINVLAEIGTEADICRLVHKLDQLNIS